MKAVFAQAYGGPEVLQTKNVAVPSPQPNEVLIKVHASAITKADAQMRTGRPYFGRLMLGLLKPKHPVPGTCFAGEIAATGAEVNRFKTGDRVVGLTTLGFSANAEYLTISSEGVLQILPENIPFTQAASICDGPLTSLNFLREIGKIQAGDAVLINGASGALGTAAVQLAKHFGAEVTGVCSERNIGLVKALGADHVIDYSLEDFSKQAKQYDIIYDTVGSVPFSRASRVLKPAGKYLCPVISCPLIWAMFTSSFIGNKRALFTATGLSKEPVLNKMLAEIIQLYQLGTMKSVIDRQYPLERVSEAHSYIDTSRKRGNIIAVSEASA